MIEVTTLSNQKLILNSDLIRTIEETPHAVITLLNGEKWIVQEDTQEVVDRAVDYQRRLRQNLDGGGK